MDKTYILHLSKGDEHNLYNVPVFALDTIPEHENPAAVPPRLREN